MSSQRYYFWYGEFIQHRDRPKEVDGDTLHHVGHVAHAGLYMSSRMDVDEVSLDFRSDAEDM